MQSNQFYALVCCILVSACGQDNKQVEAVSLRLSVPKGEGFTYNITSDQVIEQQTRGPKSKLHNNVGYVYNFEVTDETDSTLLTTARISRIRVKAGDEQQGVDYDSDVQGTGDINAQLHTIFSNLKGKPFQAVFSRMGNIVQVNGLSELIKNVQARTPGMEVAIGDQQTQNLSQALNLYPATPVKTGDTWTDEDTLLSQGLSMLAIKKYRVTNMENGILFIRVNTTFKDSPIPMPNLRVKVETDGEQEGTVEIDVKTGIIKNAKLTSEIELKISGGGESSMTTIKEETVIQGSVHKKRETH